MLVGIRNDAAKNMRKIKYRISVSLERPLSELTISRALLEASRKHVVGEDSYLLPESSELSRAAARTFNDL